MERPNPTCLKEVGEMSCGFCVWTISQKSQFVGEGDKYKLNGKPWSQIKREMIGMPLESYAKFKAFTINMCKKTNDCSKDIDKWRVKLDSLDSIGEGFK